MKKVYCFTGLGADKRVLESLQLPDYDLIYIDWIPPLTGESISEYAQRLLPQISTQNPILMGLSFGGMMMMEVAKLIPTEKLISLASAKTKHEIPFYYRIFRWLPIYKWLPTKWLIHPNLITYWLFGAKSKEEKELLKAILHDTDGLFFLWAVEQILLWENATVPTNIFHIHGTSDHILPAYFAQTDVLIQGGGHFMTVNCAKEICLNIIEYLNQPQNSLQENE
ncbi:MAG: alpha/beta fold hydrolase [Bacteroidia bacterium]